METHHESPHLEGFWITHTYCIYKHKERNKGDKEIIGIIIRIRIISSIGIKITE
jgi:hypothetical protein